MEPIKRTSALSTLLKCASICALCMITVSAKAQQAGTIQEQLRAAAKQMAKEGNDNFFVAEAMSDSLILPGHDFEFIYDTTKITLDGIPLKEPYQSKYRKLISAFYKSSKHPDTWMHRLSIGNGYTIAEVLDPTSELRNPKRNKPDMPAYPLIIQHMAVDGLLDTNKYYIISYSSKGLFVNKERLPENMEAKYGPLFGKAYQVILKKDGDVTETSTVPYNAQ